MNKFMEFVKQDKILSKLSTKGGSGLLLFLVLFPGVAINLINNILIKAILSLLLVGFFIIFDIYIIYRFLSYCFRKKIRDEVRWQEL